MQRKELPIVVVLALALLLSACGPATANPAVNPTINVTGKGSVYLTPDIAYVNIGVHTEDPNLGAAVTANNQKAQAIIDVIRAAGVAPGDIRTSNFSVYSTTSYGKLIDPPETTTYVVDNTVTVTVRDLGRLPSLLDTVVASGANTISGITFDVADKSAALSQARLLAVQNASALAGELTQASGVTLGSIKNITYADYASVPYAAYYGKGGGGGMESPSSISINPGQIELSVNVTMIYSITK